MLRGGQPHGDPRRARGSRRLHDRARAAVLPRALRRSLPARARGLPQARLHGRAPCSSRPGARRPRALAIADACAALARQRAAGRRAVIRETRMTALRIGLIGTRLHRPRARDRAAGGRRRCSTRSRRPCCELLADIDEAQAREAARRALGFRRAHGRLARARRRSGRRHRRHLHAESPAPRNGARGDRGRQARLLREAARAGRRRGGGDGRGRGRAGVAHLVGFNYPVQPDPADRSRDDGRGRDRRA